MPVISSTPPCRRSRRGACVRGCRAASDRAISFRRRAV
jgi:hypothetical protein